LNSYQHVTHAIAHKPDSPVARGELVIDRGFAKDLLNWRGSDDNLDNLSDTELLLAGCRCLNLDLACIPAGGKTVQDSILSPPPADIGPLANDGLFVFWLVNGAFQSAMADRGIMAFMTAITQAPGEVCQILQQRSHHVLATMGRGIRAGAHGIILADDIAYRQGTGTASPCTMGSLRCSTSKCGMKRRMARTTAPCTCVSPDFVEQYLLPLWRTQVNFAHGLGVPVFFHSDGDLNTVLSHIVAAGFDGLQCIESAAGMDIGAIKAQYDRQLCLMGNIDPALLCETVNQTAHAASVDDLHRAVSGVMAAASGRGGLIFGTCSGLHAGMSPERVYTMYQVAAQCDPIARAVTG
jgi:uroporphyrinogen decarboxylase